MLEREYIRRKKARLISERAALERSPMEHNAIQSRKYFLISLPFYEVKYHFQ